MSESGDTSEISGTSSVRAKLDRADQQLEQLRIQFEQYFLGILKFQPDKLNAEMKRTIRQLRAAPFKNSQMNFQLRMLEQRYQTYNSYWMRVLRQKEEGTYSRDVFKAELRAKIVQQEQEASSAKGQVRGHVKSLFDSYQQALEKQSGKSVKLDYGKFEKKIVQQAKAFKSKNGNGKLSFKVVVKEGKVTVKAQAKKKK